MDWPVIGSIAGVSALAGVLGIGAYAAWVSAPAPQKDAPRRPLLVVEQANSAPARPSPSYLATAPAPAQRYASPPSSTAPTPRLQQQASLPPVRLFERLPPLRQEPYAYARPPAAYRRPDADPRPPYRPEADRPQARPEPDARPKSQPPTEARKPDTRHAKVLTAAKIARLRIGMRLQPEQIQHWRPVAAALRKIGRTQVALIRQGQDPDVSQDMMMELYGAAQPLLGSLTETQKEKVRALARSLGYAQVASML